MSNFLDKTGLSYFWGKVKAYVASQLASKQDKPTGSQGQFVGFTADNVVGAVDAPAGLPSGGTSGQMLYQGESGAEWGDKPVMYVTITSSGDSITADKTVAEIQEAVNAGYSVIASINGLIFAPLFTIQSGEVVFATGVDNGLYVVARYKNPSGVVVNELSVPSEASDLPFNKGTTGLTATNVQDAIEEVNEKAFPATGGAITGDVILGSEGQDVSNAPKIKSPDGTVFAQFIGNGMFQIDASGDGILGNNIRIGPRASIAMIAASDTDDDRKSNINITDDQLYFKAGHNGIEFISRGGITFLAVDGIVFNSRISVPPPEIDEHAANKEYVDSRAPKSVSVTLPASGWSSNTQTVTVNGVLADESAQLIQPMPAIASQNAYISAGVICSGQAANSLTFTCSTVPTDDITLYIVLTEVSA